MRTAIIVFVFGLLMACSANNTQYKILPPQDFENLLYDLHLADAVLKHKNMSDRNLSTVYESHYNDVFVKYSISRGDFEANVREYTARTDEYMGMYDRIIERFNNEKNAIMQSDSLDTLLEELEAQE